MKFDLNCDLGEGEPLAKTRGLMRCVTSANVACGGHAGNARSMERCVRLAKELKVRLGAHPGLASKLGRGEVQITPNELQVLLEEQVGTLEQIARAQRVKLHHIKLHGSLYHATDQDKALAAAYVDFAHERWPRVKIFARAGGVTAQIARARSVPMWEEVFADRRYQDDGTLVPRGLPNALVPNVAEVLAFLRRLTDRGEIISVSGKHLSVRAQTICIHSDTPGAVRLAGACRRFLEAH